MKIFYRNTNVTLPQNKAYLGTTLIWEKSSEPVTGDELCFTALTDSTIGITQVGTSSYSKSIKYSINGGSWNVYTIGETLSLVSGNKIYWKSDDGLGMAESTSIYKQFVMSGSIAASGSIQSLFNDSDSVPDYGCFFLFYNSPLVQAPELPATTIGERGYAVMFMNCPLVQAPELPATTLADFCYGSMFSGCVNLTQAPELPATTLASNCYYSMFNSCTSLTQAPELPATTLADYCYYGMFNHCSKLNYIKALFLTEPSWSYTGDWVNDVSSTGTFIKSSDATWDVTGVYGVPSGWTVQKDTSNLCLTALEDTTVSIAQVGTATDKSSGKVIQYSFDAESWNTYTLGDSISLSKNDKVYWKSEDELPMGESTSIYKKFVMTGSISASGSIQSLFNDSDSVPSYGCCYMFSGCKSLTQAPELPATTLATYCYDRMFYNCSSLTQAPELPALKLVSHCYDSMFQNCAGLTQAPTLPATTLATYCYQYMFFGCAGLTQAPTLPATTLATYCYYYMFQGCTSLAQAPELPATSLTTSCYSSMFFGCTGLTQAPELPATTLISNCYNGMFNGCTGLTQAPELPALKLVTRCYYQMFYKCSNLNYIKAMFTTTPSTTYTSNWVSGVASSGTFVKNSAATWTTSGVSGIPSGWTIETADA